MKIEGIFCFVYPVIRRFAFLQLYKSNGLNLIAAFALDRKGGNIG